MSAAAPLLSVENLRVSFRTEEGLVRAVDGVSFTVNPGEVVEGDVVAIGGSVHVFGEVHGDVVAIGRLPLFRRLATTFLLLALVFAVIAFS